MNPAADAVRQERLRRGWSVRTAAAASHGRLSNTWWGNFEDYRQPITQNIIEAVMEAFGWPEDWPESRVEASPRRVRGLGPLIPVDVDLVDVERRVSRLEAELADLAVLTRRLAVELDADELPSADATLDDQASGESPR
jgi:hypothetical protein